MNISSRVYKGFLVLIAVGMFFGVNFTQRALNKERRELGLTRHDDPLKNAPPVLAFTTVALGGFRGLIANILWVRATDLQEQDKYFEMVQLADWITKLQPHMTTVWIHQAWNMSYNISIKFNDPMDRWQWVRRGIELLRDQGLVYNPKEPLLYRELGWHFLHKMGQNLDDAHEFYKHIWAQEMIQVLGRGPVNWDELLQPQTAEARERVRLLKEKYKLDPAWMKHVDDLYGPLEWRLPEAHALYWGSLGLEKCKKEDLKKEDFIQNRRLVFHSMQLSFHRGRLIFPSKDSYDFIYGPNLDVVERANKAYEDMMAQQPERRDYMTSGHKNFLLTAVYFLYTHNRLREAEKWFNYAKTMYTNAVPPGMDMDSYALSRVQEDIGDMGVDRTKAIILGLLRNSFVRLALGDDEQATGYMLFAQKVHNRHQAEIGIDKSTIGRVGLPPMAQLRDEILKELLDPEEGLHPELADILRTKLNLPAGATAPTRAPEPGAGAVTNAPTARAQP
jgi:hypothetical protein